MYDEILAGSKKYLCCFCSYGEPTELDHFLPKSNYPEFSVLPINLVPICHYCNRLKLNQVPLSATECYVHPYFEEYSDIQWLDADLQFEGNVPIITFHINSDLKDKNANLSRKLEYQFKQLDLNMRYSTRANSEIMEMHFRLNGLHESGGSGAVRNYLEEEAYYRAEKNKNSWDSVLYYCISKNHKFCELYWNTK